MKLSLDSPVYHYLSTLAVYIALNFLFLVLCLPVFTAGAAYCALYSVSLKEADGRYEYVFRSFISAFKKNFLSSLAAETIYAAVLAGLLFGIVFWYGQDTIATGIAAVIMAVLFLGFLASGEFCFALMAEYGAGAISAVRIGTELTLRHRGYALLLAAIDAAVVWSVFRFAGFRVFMLIVGNSFFVYIRSWLILKVFGKYPSAE